MRRRTVWMAALTLAVLTTPFMMQQAAAGDEPWCAWTATQARIACGHDVADDFHLTRGNCLNLTDFGDRKECRYLAWETRQEDREECVEQREARLDLCDELGGTRYDPQYEPGDFVHPDEIVEQNPFQSLKAGHTSVVRAGEDGEELVVIHVSDETIEIDGVDCRVVIDIVVEVDAGDEEDAIEYVPVEVTDDWFAYHDATGDIWYFGELAREYVDGRLDSLDGSFEAGVEYAKPGVLVPFDPMVTDIYRQEYALQEAEDVAEVLSRTADLPELPDRGADGYDCEGACLQTRDFSPLDPGVEENKYYIEGIGFVLATSFEDDVQTDEIEELQCSGDSLDVLSDPDCGIEDLPQLLDALCELSEAFCTDK